MRRLRLLFAAPTDGLDGCCGLLRQRCVSASEAPRLVTGTRDEPAVTSARRSCRAPAMTGPQLRDLCVAGLRRHVRHGGSAQAGPAFRRDFAVGHRPGTAWRSCCASDRHEQLGQFILVLIRISSNLLLGSSDPGRPPDLRASPARLTARRLLAASAAASDRRGNHDRREQAAATASVAFIVASRWVRNRHRLVCCVGLFHLLKRR